MKLKKTGRFIACVCVFLWIFSLSVFASEYSAEELREYIPEDILEILPEDIFSSDSEKSASAVAEISGFSFVLNYILRAFSMSLPSALSLFFTVLGLVILCSVVKLLGAHIKSASVLSAFEMCTLLSLAALVWETQYILIAAAKEYLSALGTLVGAMMPVMSAVYAAGGNITGAAVNATGMMVFLSVCEVLCADVLLPLVRICYGLFVATLISGGINIGAVAKLIKQFSYFAVGFVSAVCAAVMAYQSVLAQGADNTASKIVKFSLGSLVPVVGGAIGDSVKTLSASLSLIKSTVGVLGIVLIAFMILPLIIELFLHKSVLCAGSAFCHLLGCEREGKFFSEVAGIQNLIIAVCTLSSLMFVVALSLFINAALVVGI